MQHSIHVIQQRQVLIVETKVRIEKKKKIKILPIGYGGFAWEAAFHTCDTAL
jgi:hypothetical protein